MFFELVLPFSCDQSIGVSENNNVWEWNFVNFSKFIRFSVKFTPSDENVAYTTRTFCSILEKQQKIKSCASVPFVTYLGEYTCQTSIYYTINVGYGVAYGMLSRTQQYPVRKDKTDICWKLYKN